MRVITHPEAEQLHLTEVLHALSDPVRLEIVRPLGDPRGALLRQASGPGLEIDSDAPSAGAEGGGLDEDAQRGRAAAGFIAPRRHRGAFPGSARVRAVARRAGQFAAVVYSPSPRRNESRRRPHFAYHRESVSKAQACRAPFRDGLPKSRGWAVTPSPSSSFLQGHIRNTANASSVLEWRTGNLSPIAARRRTRTVCAVAHRALRHR